MAIFLETLANRQEKEYYLKQGFTHKIDIDQSLLILAANQQREQTFDQENHEDIISTSSKKLNEVCLSFIHRWKRALLCISERSETIRSVEIINYVFINTNIGCSTFCQSNLSIFSQ